MGALVCNGGGNCFEHASAICHHIKVAKAKNLKPLGFDSRRSVRIRLFSASGKMLTSVKLNDKFGGMAHKICNIIFNWDLPAEAGPAQPMVT